ncbi:ABC transporter permease [Spirochaetia bacterium]|nr:ABC transporter permease [Spirochaetia bacterium]
MIKKTILRLASAVFAVFGASVLSFVLLRFAPGDSVGLVLGPFATEAAKIQLAAEMGLDKSMPVQYGLYVRDLFSGNWGYSYSMGQPIYELFASRLPASLELSMAALFFTFITALLLALVKTYTKRGGIKKGIDLFCYAGYSMPQFFLGLMALVIFSGALGIFPGPEGRTRFPLFSLPRTTGFLILDSLIAGNLPLFLDALWHLVLPAFTLGLYSTAFLTRILQANLEQAYGEKFITVSLSRGISEWYALVRHALPNALVTTATAAAVLTGILITGTMLVETVFAWPGIGALITLSIQKKDFSVVQAFVFFSAVIFILSNLVVEVLITKIDPRLNGTRDIL